MRPRHQTDRYGKSAKKFSCRQHSSTGSLQLQEPHNPLASRDAQSRLIRTEDRARGHGVGCFTRRVREPYLDDHSPNLHGASGPREQAANPRRDFHSGTCEIQATISLCETSTIRGGSVILLNKLQGTVGQLR